MPNVPLDTWLDTMTTVEDLIRIREKGFGYVDETKLSMAETMCQSIGIDLIEWLNEYWDFRRFL